MDEYLKKVGDRIIEEVAEVVVAEETETMHEEGGEEVDQFHLLLSAAVPAARRQEKLEETITMTPMVSIALNHDLFHNKYRDA